MYDKLEEDDRKIIDVDFAKHQRSMEDTMWV